MLKTAQPHHGLTRRTFLKTTAAAAVGAGVLGSLAACAQTEQQEPQGEGEGEQQQEEEPQLVEEQTYFNSCMGNCSGWGCPCYVHVRDGKVANITRAKLTCPDGSPSPYQETCLKGYANIERMYSPTRLQTPMRRVASSPRGLDAEWEQISWDDAITEITDKWKELREEYGNNAVAFAPGSCIGMATVGYNSRLGSLMGVLSIASCYDTTGMFCQWTHCGFNPLVNGHNEVRDMENCDNLFIWGTNPSESMIVDYHMVSEVKEKGATVVVIDPIYTTSAAKADIYVPIRPATDGLLACGMAQIAIRDGFVDRAHLQTMTVAPFLVKDSDGLYLRLSDLGQAEAGSADDRILVYEGGAPVAYDAATDPELEGSFTVEGIAVKPAYQILLDRLNEWDLETISSYTDVPIETIEELSALYTSGLSFVFTGFGPDHYSNGQTAYDAIFALADITGMECKHGAGVGCSDFSTPVPQGNSAPTTADLGDAAQVQQTVYAPHLNQLIKEGHLGNIEVAPKSIYVYGGNPIGNEPDRLKWVEVFSAMDMVVVADMFMTETATYADYVLPVAFMYERNDLTASQNQFIKICEKAVEPQFESKGGFEIVTLLGKAMGFDEYFTMTEDEFLEACVTNDTAKQYGVSWEKLQEEKAIYAFIEEPAVVGLNTPPLTATGRMEFYHEGITPQAPDIVGDAWDMKKESCWFWEPPLEAWHENPLAEQYPLIFISERAKFKTHTMFNNAPMLLEIDPEPYVKINPTDAEARGIKEGDTVRLFNDRGDVTLKAVLNAGVRPGMLVIDHGWEEANFIAGHYSNLSSCATWPRYEQANWFDCLCEMEKVQ